MKYMLLMQAPKSGFEKYRTWSVKDAQTHLDALDTIRKNLTDSGEFVATDGLAWPQEARVVRSGRNGMPITDGVFPESKEFLAGYWIVEVDRPERAYEIAAQISAAPGPGGVPTDMPIEVRQIMIRNQADSAGGSHRGSAVTETNAR